MIRLSLLVEALACLLASDSHLVPRSLESDLPHFLLGRRGQTLSFVHRRVFQAGTCDRSSLACNGPSVCLSFRACSFFVDHHFLTQHGPVAQCQRDVSANRLRRSSGRGTSASTSLANTDSLLERATAKHPFSAMAPHGPLGLILCQP